MINLNVYFEWNWKISASSADGQKLEEMVRDLSAQLTNVKHEQEYMEVRERVHRSSKFRFSMKLLEN